MFKQNHEHIQNIIIHLKNAAENAAILVEGKKDKQALRNLGIGSEIFLLQANCKQFAAPRTMRSSVNKKYKSLIETSEEIAKKSHHVILMLDSDPKGLELTKKMKNHLQSQGVHVDTRVGKTLLRVANSQVVESLDKRFLK